ESPGRTRSTLRAASPAITGDLVAWSSPELDLEGRWTALAAPVESTLLDTPEGRVHWRCHQPRARAEIILGPRVFRGLGYTEHLELTVEPWRMPIDELRWGRFVGERSSLVWIDWRGEHRAQVVLLDGAPVRPGRIDERSVADESEEVRLDIAPGEPLRRGPIGETIAGIPGIERFPLRILAVEEKKWCARGTLKDGRGSDQGWVVHEVVRWPPRHAHPGRHRGAGKLLYGLSFVVVLPALLVEWARRTAAVVHAPVWHAPRVGVALCATGIVALIAGWHGLWRHGGGLPMNAFPPPRLATRGIYAWLAHPIYVGFAAASIGASLAAGSASGLWLVSPFVVLGSAALVLGYESHDLDVRFGASRPQPLIARVARRALRAFGAETLAAWLWRPLRAFAEGIANSWSEVRVGRLRVISHGIWAALAAAGGVAGMGALLGPGHVAAILVAALAALVGAGISAQLIEGSSRLSRPYGFHGGLVGVCLAALAAPLFGTPTWLLLGAYAVVGPYVQAMGRLRCLVQGCCHGRPTSPSVGIRYRHPRSRVCRIANLDCVPLHATPLYSILWNGLTLLVVGRLWTLRAALHLVTGVYLLWNGLGRFVEEAYRGEPQTPVIARLRLYQWIALAQIAAGALATALGSSGPAPTPWPNAGIFAPAVMFGVITFLAMGVDFPESERRFSRLA
ncbi:MAG: prolipoprotein diacylglyceryl transferase, partial [Myxococcales bacterium]|nr:prolipoprotein diacylglyceryl transferase [Myxococcales bacterium]